MLNKLTTKQQKVLEYYNSYIQETGHSPTYREAGKVLGLSASVVFTHIKNLELKGYLWANLGNIQILSDTQQIPLLGSVACGEPIAVMKHCEEYIDIPKAQLRGGGSFYALRANGQSMKDAGIMSWDILIIQSQSDVSDGEIGVVVVWEYADDERATLKRVYHSPTALILKPANDSFPTQIVTNHGQIRGKLVSVIRNF